jgi:hypothetical protein
MATILRGWNRGTSQINVESIGIAAPPALCNFQFAIIPDSPYPHDLVISARVRFTAAIVQLDLYQRVPHA